MLTLLLPQLLLLLLSMLPAAAGVNIVVVIIREHFLHVLFISGLKFVDSAEYKFSYGLII